MLDQYIPEKYRIRFLSKIEMTETCWIWRGTQKGNGYGQFSIHRRERIAHRVSYEIHKGAIPQGLELDHLCRNRLCVNPDHLEPVTRRVNMLRGENFCAVHAKRTHCPKGHPYEGDNLKFAANGQRFCRECKNAYLKRYYREVTKRRQK